MTLATGGVVAVLLAVVPIATASEPPIRFAVLAHDAEAKGWNNRLMLFTRGAHERNGDQVVAFPLGGDRGAFARPMKSPETVHAVWQVTPGAGYGIGRQVVHSVRRRLRVQGKARANGAVEYEGQGIGKTQHFTFRESQKQQSSQLASLLPASGRSGGGSRFSFFCKARPKS